jgi:DnaJ-class molecular chaperone
MEEDYYKILGVNRNASASDIQKAYRALARKYHPDVNPDDQAAKQKFQRIQTAYEVLNDPEKREMYDRYGSSFESMGSGGPHGSYQSYGGPQGFDEFDFSQIFGGPAGHAGGEGSFGDFFRQFAGGGAAHTRRSGRRPARGTDVRHEVQIPFNTSITGGEVQLRVQRPQGERETISVKIPAGIEDGRTIRLRGQGEPSIAGGAPGDLLITVQIAPHACFQRRGHDLVVTVPVTLAEAALGSKVDVPTPGGVIALTIPRATSSGKRLRIKGHGVPDRDGKKGDLFAEIQIVMPESIDDESAELIRQLDQRQTFDPRRGLKW